MAYTARWTHVKPQVQACFQQVQHEHPDAWEKCRHPQDDKEFIQLVAALAHQTIPELGLNGKRGNAADISKDVIAFPNPSGCRDDRPNGYPGLELVDIITKHETLEASWGWNDVTQATIDGGAAGEWLLPGQYPGGETKPPAPTHTTQLWASLFWGLGGEREGWGELPSQLVEYAAAGVDAVRTLISLRGNVDAWDIIGMHWTDPNLPDVMRRYMDRVSSYRSAISGQPMRVEWTLVGDTYKLTHSGEQDQFVDIYTGVVHDRLHQVALHEIANEYGNIGGDLAMLHRMATRLCRNLGRSTGPAGSDLLVSLSSPEGTHRGRTDAEIAREVRDMYDGFIYANAITPHWYRKNHVPPNLGPYCPSYVICGEPRGPSSSVAETDDPRVLVFDYQQAIQADYHAYVLHSDAGVWSVYITDEYKRPDRGQWPVFSTHDNGPAILQAMGEVRATGSSSGAGGGGEGGGEPMIPYDEAKSIEFGLACNDVYIESGAPHDPGMVSVHSSRAAWDFYVGGLPWEESKRKHINEFRAVYGLPPI